MSKMSKPIIYIAGAINADSGCQAKFERAERDLIDADFVALNPATLPLEMSDEKRMRIHLAMLDCADAVLLLPGWHNSREATIESAIANRLKKPTVIYPADEPPASRLLSLGVALDSALRIMTGRIFKKED